MSARIHGNRLKKLDGRERVRVDEVGAAVLVGRNRQPVNAQAQVHVCNA